MLVLLVAACASEEDADIAVSDPQEVTGPSISNAGFEGGWTSWTRSGTTGLSTIVHSGSSSGKVSSSTGKISRTVGNLKPGTQYTLSAWVLGGARVGAKNFGGTSASKSTASTSWTQLKVVFTTGASNTSAEIYASWVSGGDARVDDFTLLETTPPPPTCTMPSQLIDLSRWKVQVPVGSPAEEIGMPELATQQMAPYFRVAGDCSAVMFRSPTDGTTTKGTEYPRAELREMAADGVTKAAWSTSSGTHTMVLDEAVVSVPRGRKYVIAAQVHDGTNDVLTVRMNDGRLYVRTHAGTETTLDKDYTLGKRFNVKLVATGGVISVYYNGATTPIFKHSQSVSTAFFKAGAYTQSNCDTEAQYGQTCGSDNYGEVAMYNVTVVHN